MKNLKGIVFGFIAMVAMIGGVSAADYTECKAPTNNYFIKNSDTTYKCEKLLSDALNAVKAGGEIVLLKDVTPYSDITINKDITFDLNGHTIDMAGQNKSITVEGANVTFKNGIIAETNNASGGHFKVDSSEKASTLTIADDVTVTGIGISSAFIKITDATNDTVVNVNGTWTLKNEIVDCDANDRKLVINLNADVTADDLQTNALVTTNQGASVVNVNGGSYTSNKTIFELTQGTLNISGGTIKSTSKSAIVVKEPTPGKSKLNISGGDISSSAKYSLHFDSGTSSKNGTYSISNGTFTSGTDAEGNQLPAIYIGSQGFLTNHPGIITGGTFTNGIVGDVQVEKGEMKYAAAATSILIAQGTPSTTENGTVIVGNSDDNQNDDQNQVVDGDNIGGATDSNEANPNTADVNLMTLVGTILVGLVGFAYTMKNRLFN